MIARHTLGIGPAYLALILAGVWAVAGATAAGKDKPPAADRLSTEDVNDIHLEVDALQTISLFDLDSAQLEALGKLAQETAPTDRKREPARASDKYRKALLELRNALRADDDDRIETLTDALAGLRAREQPRMDEAVELTEAARKKAPEFLARLRARQVAAYLASLEDEDLDGPAERLKAALVQSRKLTGTVWTDARDAVAEEAGFLAAGLDADASARTRDAARELLDRAHELKDADYKTQREDLDRAAFALVGDVHPVDVIRHNVEHALAELLSNPRLGPAVEARLKASK